jgi:hypothetical protein
MVRCSAAITRAEAGYYRRSRSSQCCAPPPMQQDPAPCAHLCPTEPLLLCLAFYLHCSCYFTRRQDGCVREHAGNRPGELIC